MVMTFAMVYVSCSKDDEGGIESANYSKLIVGTWTVTYNDYYGTNVEVITFSDGGYFEAKCSLSTYRGDYAVVENVVHLEEKTGKYPLDVIVIKNMDESSFVGTTDIKNGEIKGTRIK